MDRVLVALTKEALYLLSEPNADEVREASDCVSADGNENGTSLPHLLLRRRIELRKISGMVMSTLADDFLIMRVRGDSRMEEDR